MRIFKRRVPYPGRDGDFSSILDRLGYLLASIIGIFVIHNQDAQNDEGDPPQTKLLVWMYLTLFARIALATIAVIWVVITESVQDMDK